MGRRLVNLLPVAQRTNALTTLAQRLARNYYFFRFFFKFGNLLVKNCAHSSRAVHKSYDGDLEMKLLKATSRFHLHRSWYDFFIIFFPVDSFFVLIFGKLYFPPGTFFCVPVLVFFLCTAVSGGSSLAYCRFFGPTSGQELLFSF